jgi:hypothetical protein
MVGYVTGTGQARIALDVGSDAVCLQKPAVAKLALRWPCRSKPAAWSLALDVQKQAAGCFR